MSPMGTAGAPSKNLWVFDFDQGQVGIVTDEDDFPREALASVSARHFDAHRAFDDVRVGEDALPFDDDAGTAEIVDALGLPGRHEVGDIAHDIEAYDARGD